MHQWIRMGWGSEFSDVFHEEKQLHIDLSNLTPTYNKITEIAKRVIRDISNQYPAPYNLMVSGGSDSQTMLWCWMHSGVPFNCISIEYVDNTGKVYNEHDLEQLKEFANKFNIPITYKQLNIFDFLENHLYDYAAKYRCTSPHICSHMKIAEMVSGTNIFSGNFIQEGCYNYTVLGLKRYADVNTNVIPFFLLHDAELAAAMAQFMYDPLEDQTKGLEWHIEMLHKYNNKISILHKAGIPVIPQKTKFTGFELIKDYYDEHNTLTPIERIRYGNMPSKRAFDILFRYKLSEQVKYNDMVVYLYKDELYSNQKLTVGT